MLIIIGLLLVVGGLAIAGTANGLFTLCCGWALIGAGLLNPFGRPVFGALLGFLGSYLHMWYVFGRLGPMAGALFALIFGISVWLGIAMRKLDDRQSNRVSRHC